jgi:hypothetical protein
MTTTKTQVTDLRPGDVVRHTNTRDVATVVEVRDCVDRTQELFVDPWDGSEPRWWSSVHVALATNEEATRERIFYAGVGYTAAARRRRERRNAV